ncbi:hypothetical protein NDU88_004483 [Pleurodeles waltl]|uniref:Uncharacterized protein n=1 Tax=Pleurodeles waltl TaxID=8319 RepID=A0AAV7QFJ3_PLEWA|nr:hypothetical protein NDU88_004483 [Pleurodeles waltl]
MAAPPPPPLALSPAQGRRTERIHRHTERRTGAGRNGELCSRAPGSSRLASAIHRSQAHRDPDGLSWNARHKHEIAQKPQIIREEQAARDPSGQRPQGDLVRCFRAAASGAHGPVWSPGHPERSHRHLSPSRGSGAGSGPQKGRHRTGQPDKPAEQEDNVMVEG